MLRQRTSSSRRGNILPLMAFSMVGLIGFVALAIDVGMLALAKNQAQNAADVAAITGLRTLNGDPAQSFGEANATTNAESVAGVHRILNTPIEDSQLTMRMGAFRYNPDTNEFDQVFPAPANENRTLVEAEVRYNRTYSFAQVFRLLGMTGNGVQVQATARAVHRPRDIAMVLDFSGSMNSEAQIWNTEGHYTGGTKNSPNNSDPLVPQFGPYSCGTNFSLPGGGTGGFNPTLLVQTNTTDPRVGFCNISHEANGLPPIVDDFFRDTGAYSLATGTRAFSAAPAGNQTNPGGDIPLRRGGLVRSDTSVPYAKTLYEILADTDTMPGGVPAQYNEWQTSGYDRYYGTTTAINVTLTTPVAVNRTFTPENTPALRPQPARKFQGYTIGPAFYGMTFFIWPPDPRTPTGLDMDAPGYLPGDWRKRFFLNDTVSTFPNTTFDDTAAVSNNRRLWTAGGVWKDPQQTEGGQPGYRINYRAILAWIREVNDRTNVFPPRLVAGRVLYYDQIPQDVPAEAYNWNTSNNNIAWANQSQRFWKEYIDFVLGVWKSSVDPAVSTMRPNTDGCSFGPDFTWTGGNTSNAQINAPPTNGAYMDYRDRPQFPRHRFWFGPMTMIEFLIDYARLPGTAHDNAMFIMKVGLQAAFQDMQLNYPNTLCSLAMFNRPAINGEPSVTGKFSVPHVPLTGNYPLLIRSLFFPPGSVPGDEIGVFTPAFTGVPSAAGGGYSNTASAYGFVMAHNQLSSNAAARSTVINGVSIGGFGRRGSDRLVLFETDGLANVGTIPGDGSFVKTGNSSYYALAIDNSGVSVSSNISSGGDARTQTYKVVNRLVAQETDMTNGPGFARPNLPVTVHTLAFGILMEPESAGSAQTDVINFLNNVSTRGGTRFPNSPNDADDGYKWVIGTGEQRIARLRRAIQSALRSGVRIALVEVPKFDSAGARTGLTQP
jgi:Flp pilus assembly protein TadG